jgi:hypothetical protein
MNLYISENATKLEYSVLGGVYSDNRVKPKLVEKSFPKILSTRIIIS